MAQFILFEKINENRSEYILYADSDPEFMESGETLEDLARTCFYDKVIFRQCDGITTIPAPVHSMGYDSRRVPVSSETLNGFIETYLKLKSNPKNL
jgi:hypothetical protein